MRALRKLTVALGTLALASSAVGITAGREAGASEPVTVQQTAATVTIKDFIYNPADVAVKVGQPVTIKNDDGFPHTVTAKDGTFDLDVPANGSVTLTVSKAGSFPYMCTYHPGQHNPAAINVS